jgi:hypothetical protein
MTYDQEVATMPDTFTISTTDSTTVALDSARQGSVAFTVTNVSGQTLKTRGYVVPDNSSSPNWFAPMGSDVTDIAAGGSQQYSYKIVVPADKPAGSYSFHFSVVGVDNPDEQFAQGPEMSLVVTAAPVHPPVKKGYVEAVVGGLVGALAGGALGAMPGVIFVLTTGQVKDLGQAVGDALVFALLAVVGAAIGLWVGSAIGVWSVLRSRKYDYPGTSGCLMAVLIVILWVLAGFLLSVLKLQEPVSTILTVVVLVIVTAGAALAARAATLFLRARQV